ncbi:Hypothetical predicted protein [Mytilus galloprovincialis]|uniref:C1q domain-containing protein n=2 Tax=Mytilus galloprovincialis TaxID=29158 RepID=A0A8B6CV87_MYTGA|nr:Hypothetical predicted protein [Mytilus galloprovincialis]
MLCLSVVTTTQTNQRIASLIYINFTNNLMKTSLEDMSYELLFINAIVIALIAMYVYVYGRERENSTKFDISAVAVMFFVVLMAMYVYEKAKGTWENSSKREQIDIPAFSASMTNAKVLGATEIVQFDKVWTNNGNDYDPHTGIFKSPINGVYQFSFTVMSSSGKSLLVYLWQNENRLVAVYPGNGYNEGTANMVLNLQKGDRVYVKCGGSDHGYIHTSNGYWYSMFSGYLIHATK